MQQNRKRQSNVYKTIIHTAVMCEILIPMRPSSSFILLGSLIGVNVSFARESRETFTLVTALVHTVSLQRLEEQKLAYWPRGNRPALFLHPSLT